MSTQRMSNNRHHSRPKPSIPRPKDRRGGNRWLWIWLGLTGVGMLSAMAGAILAVSLSATPLRQVFLSHHDDDSVFQDDTIALSNLRFPSLTRPVNILVLGVKVLSSDLNLRLPPEEDPGYLFTVDSFEGRSDTMLLLRFDPQLQKLTVLSIPRDTQTTIPGYGTMKINAANAHGGPALTAKAVSHLLADVPIDRYVRVNVQGVEKLIDALGGVNLYVPTAMRYTDHSQHLYINLQEGEQHLDGEKALQFLRFRYDQYGDIGRVQRQQTFMRALVEQVLRPSTLMRIPRILQVIRENIDTNLSVEELAALAGFAAQVDRGNIQMLMLPGEFNGTGQNGVSYWLPHHRQIENLMAQHFNQGFAEYRSRNTNSLRIAIQDSTGDREAVDTVVTMLYNQGYRNVQVGRRWREPLETSRIVAQRGDDSSAFDVRRQLGIGEVRVESTGELSSDITIQLGEDWRKLKNGN